MSDSNFHRSVFEIARHIPRGKVASYGQIAAMMGYIQGGRPVGAAMRHAPRDVPWQRVVRNDGSLGCVEGQRALLLREGVNLLPSGKIDMKKHRWDGK